MKKFKIIVLFFMFSFMPFFSFAQWAVIDVTAIAAAIENGYTLYQTLNNAYQSYQKSVEMYAHLQKMAQGIDFSNPALMAERLYNSMEDTINQKLNDLESIYTVKNMDINGYRFSIEDLYSTDVYGKILQSYDGMSEADIARLTTEEERAFFAANGISPKNGLIIKSLGEQMNKSLVEGQAKLETTKDIPGMMKKYCDNITKESKLTGEIALAQQQSDIAANQLKIAVESYELTRDQLKLTQARYALEQKKDEQEAEAMVYMKSLTSDIDYESSINEDSSYLGPTRKK